MSRKFSLVGVVVASTFLALGCAVGVDAETKDESSALSAGCVALDLAEQAKRCDAPPPSEASPEGFRHDKMNDEPRHRGRDMFFREGETQWIVAKFAYGTLFNRLNDEDVDIHVLQSCGTEWKKLARVRTSDRHHGSTNIEGFEDDEGRVIFQIPSAQRLPVGRHRVRLVAAADGSAAELFIEVVPRGTKLAVIDVDGTINLGIALDTAFRVIDVESPVREGAPEALHVLADKKGMRPFYLTARADLDIARTREFIRARGLPEGVIHTSHALVGLIGKPATALKVEELAFQKARGLAPALAFGNQKSDAEAFESAGVARGARFYFGYDDDQYGGRRIDSYRDLVSEFSALPASCTR